jgi:hypothetical protein
MRLARTVALVLAGFTAAVVVGVIAGAFWLMNARESCACVPPPSAYINGMRYEIKPTPVHLENVAGHMKSVGPISSRYEDLNGTMAYSLDGVDPKLYMVIPASRPNGTAGSYVELWNWSRQFADGLCDYLPADRAALYDSCQGQ